MPGWQCRWVAEDGLTGLTEAPQLSSSVDSEGTVKRTRPARSAWILVASLVGTPVAFAQPRPVGMVAGARVGVASSVGDESSGVAAGYTLSPRLGYGLPFGLTPALAVSYSRWSTSGGSRWELSAFPGIRWERLQQRVRPWVEGALGYGQLVHEETNGRVDIGLRIESAMGLDVALSERVLLGAHFGFNRLYGSGEPGYVSTWLDLGVGITLRER